MPNYILWRAIRILILNSLDPMGPLTTALREVMLRHLLHQTDLSWETQYLWLKRFNLACHGINAIGWSPVAVEDKWADYNPILSDEEISPA